MATELGVGPGRGGRRGGYGRLADRETGKTEMDSIGLDLGFWFGDFYFWGELVKSRNRGGGFIGEGGLLMLRASPAV
jgi:hypothetical protein